MIVCNADVIGRIEDVRRHIGEGADRLIPAFVPREMSEVNPRELEDFRSDLFKREYLRKVEPFPKVPELFRRISGWGAARPRLVLCPRRDRPVQGAADDARSSKPSPDIFLEALARLVPITASESCVIGDTKI
jgi:beta-phosphoglucomutase-like phosphatase (HAD superfamily)